MQQEYVIKHGVPLVPKLKETYIKMINGYFGTQQARTSEVEMEYIRDREKVIKEIEKTLKEQKDNIKYAYVEKVKIRNKYTKEEQVIKDLYFLAINNGSCKPYCVMAIEKSNKMFILHDDVTHWNMDSCTNRFELPNNIKVYYRSFCNTVLMKHIWENPDHASKFLVGTLSEGNPNDRFRTPNSVEVDRKVPPIFAAFSSQVLDNKATLAQIILRRFDTSNLSRDEKVILKEYETQLKEKDKVFAYYAHKNSFPAEFRLGVIDKKEIDKKYIVSNYYKTYTIDDMQEIGEIPREEIDVGCVGCGSAGSGIMAQLARTEYMNSCLLVDYDVLESKNMRNQEYSSGQIGMLKTDALATRIRNSRVTDIHIARYPDKYENVNFSQYKFKYLISGFDSIECRLGLLELIKSKTIETKYLIDTRYDELNSSLYIVDTSKEIEIEYYEKLLKADKEEFEAKGEPEITSKKWTTDEARNWAETNAIHGSCRHAARLIDLDQGQDNRICDHMCTMPSCTCGSDTCINLIKQALEQQEVEHTIDQNSCQHVNIIHIYKLTSAWVLSAIRSIETDYVKPVTHVEITAEPLPNAIIIKK